MARAARDLKQQDVAREAGISVSYLSQIEHDRRAPTMELLARVAAVLGVSVPLLGILAAEDHELNGLSEDLAQRLGAEILGALKRGDLERA
jgi:transcriptional regulator with XRE-family HTH domain